MQNAVWDRLAALDEESLRLQVIIPTLERTPGIDQVTDVHGVNERGLDVIFFTVDHIRRTCYGLQLKRGDIAGGGSKDRTVKQIVDQLDLANQFRHPVAIQPSGEYRIERFIVATNGRISATAREEIARRIDPMFVDFWDLSDILRRANAVYPEILQTADTQALAYLKFVEARCETLDALDQVTGIAKRNLSDVFVEPYLRRRFDPGLADPEATPSGRHMHTLPALEISNLGQNAVIIGEQNEGKTALLRMLAIERVKKLMAGDTDLEDSGQMPVLVRALAIVGQDSLASACATVLERGGASDRAKRLRDTHDLTAYVVLVDGFSELPDEDKKRECERLIQACVTHEQGPRLLLTARPDEFLRPGHFDGFLQYTIEDFEPAQVRALVRKWTSDTVEFQDVAEKMVDRVREALQLPGSPIPAIIGVMLYEKEHKFITNTAEAVDRYMVIRLGRYAHEMGVRMQVEWQRKQDMLADVAFEMVESGSEDIEVDAAVAIMDRRYHRLGESPASEVAIDELVSAGVLNRTGSRLSFYRTAFRDFFAARSISNNHEGFDAFFRRHLFDRQWGQVLVLAAGLRRHNSSLLSELTDLVMAERDQLSVSDNEDYLYGGYLLGRILSNSDMTERDTRLKVLRSSVAAARESATIIAEEAKRQFGNIGEVIALFGSEHTMLVTVGVPWLADQLRELADDADLSEEERYLLASVYTHLACEDWLEVLESAVKRARDPRVVAALVILLYVLEGERDFAPGDARKFGEIKKALDRKRRRIKKAVDSLFEMKGPALQIERERIRRLEAKGRREKGGKT